ncbi:MAG: type I restriction-modification enzyme R subunit C-terminal domain-containing protein, partial [Elusimicrobiota bacterium]|nr:type I restriction-modification enzyme R subunit C-terminal domain-containing protein [Elusimicrobiota bacterium]
IPTIKERMGKGFNGYIDTYNFTDDQIKTLRRIKDIFVANKLEKREVTVDDIFANPIFEKLVGSKAEVEAMFDNKFDKVINSLEKSLKI